MPRRYGPYQRMLAWLLSREGGAYAASLDGRKRLLMEGLGGTVMEIGAGAGPNLRFLSSASRVVGVEPNPFMHPYFLRNARKSGRGTFLVRGLAESLPFPDGSVDGIISTLVLCSVKDVDAALKEFLRVLKPGGRYLFIEHVAAEAGSRLRRVQGLIRPLWRRMGDGCEPDRNTGERILDAGFGRIDLHRFTAPLPIVSPHIAGIAEK